jgi:hypothetical protein
VFLDSLIKITTIIAAVPATTTNNNNNFNINNSSSNRMIYFVVVVVTVVAVAVSVPVAQQIDNIVCVDLLGISLCFPQSRFLI